MFAVVSCTRCFSPTATVDVYPSIRLSLDWCHGSGHALNITQSWPSRPPAWGTSANLNQETAMRPNQWTWEFSIIGPSWLRVSKFSSYSWPACGGFQTISTQTKCLKQTELVDTCCWAIEQKNKTLSCVEMILDWKLNVALKPSFHHWKGISKLAHVWLPEGKSIDYPLISHYYPNSIPMNLRWSLSISIMIRKKSKELLWGS